MGAQTIRAAALATLAWGLAATPAVAQSSEPTHLRLAFARIEGEDVDLVRQQVARFTAAHPGVEIEVVAQRQRREDEVHDLWARYLALGDPSIDVYVIDDPWVSEFAFAGWIRPLDELDGWARKAIHPAGLRSGTWRGHLYAIPLELSANALFYRRDLLAAHGLGPPHTLEELIADAHQLAAADQLQYGLLVHTQFLYNDVNPFLWASGGGPLRDGKVTVDDPVNAQVLSLLHGEVGPHGALPDAGQLRLWHDWPAEYHDAIAGFGAGHAAFMINWLRYRPEGITADEYAIAPIPGLAGHGPGTGATLGSWFLAVNASSRHADVASELIQYLSSEDATLERFQKLGTFPPLARFYDDPAWTARYPELAVAGTIFANAQPRMPVADERAVDPQIDEAYREILIEGDDPTRRLASAAARTRAEVSSFPDQPVALPDSPLPESENDRARGRIVLEVAAAVWVLALAMLAIGTIEGRRRGGLFRSLATEVSVLGLTAVLLALTTGTAVALSVLVQNQGEAIEDAQSIFRTSIREHSQSLGRQVALGASVVGEAATTADDAVIQHVRDRARKNGVVDLSQADAELANDETIHTIDRNADQSLEVLAAEGAYNRDVLFLQVLDEDGSIVVDDKDFLEKRSGAQTERRVIDDPIVRQVARFGRRMSMRDVPASGDQPAYLEVMVPLIQNGLHAGAVRIGYSKAQQEARIAALRSRQEHLLSRAILLVTVAAVGLVGLATLLLLLFARSVALPLVRLSQLAAKVGAGDLTVRCDVGGRDEVGALARRLNDMVDGLRERQLIREALGRYVGPSVSEVILAGQIELGGEEREVTLLFSDVRGFTAMAESMKPPEVVRVLNAYFEQMVESVFQHHGMLDKFIGDGLMAVFGAPRDVADHALCAVRCALDMRQRLIAVNATLREAGLSELNIGIGLHTGTVVVGNIGSTKRTEYTAIGDNVNLAARLESQTKEQGVDILMSEATFRTIADAVVADRLGEVQVKGKQRGVVIYALRGMREPAAPATA